MERLKFDVSGQTFAIRKKTLLGGPDSALKRMCVGDNVTSQDDVIIIDRPPEAFGAVLALYQTGELHIPVTSCPGAFLRELKYWNVSMDNLASCCHFRLQRFLKEQSTLHSFQARLRALTADSADGCSDQSACRALGRVRKAIWTVVDNRGESWIASVYFAVSVLMILLSIFTLSFGTDPMLMRPMTNCERLEIMLNKDVENTELVRDMLEANCHGTDINVTDETMNVTFSGGDEDNIVVSVLVEEKEETEAETDTTIAPPGAHDPDNATTQTFRTLVPWIESTTLPTQSSFPKLLRETTNLFTPVPEPGASTHSSENTHSTSNNPISKLVSPPMPFLNDSSFIISTETHNLSEGVMPPPFKKFTSSFQLKKIRIPNKTIPPDVFHVLEMIVMVYFTLDLLLRLVTCPSIIRYFMSVVNITDALALLASYVHFALVLFLPRRSKNDTILGVMKMLQMFRSFRLFRVVVGFNISKVLAFSFVQNFKDLLIMFVYMFAGMCIFSTFLYIFEDEETVEDIPSGMYWAIVTMTTVGYGDIVPKTKMGHLVGSLCAISGVMVFALAVPLVVNHFITLYQYVGLEDMTTAGRTSDNTSGDDDKWDHKSVDRVNGKGDQTKDSHGRLNYV